MNEPIGGIILAGGRSRRMGTNKALLKLEANGPTIIEKVVAALGAVATDILLVTNEPTQYEGLGLPMVGDNYKVGASLAGLEAGLSAAKQAYNIVVACDMPYIEIGVLRWLAERQRDYAALVPVSPEGQLETLGAVYSRECLGAIRQKLAQGEYKMAGWLSEVKTVWVNADELAAYDPEWRSFINLNTPEEFERFKSELRL